MVANTPVARLALGTAQFGLNYGIANKSGLVCDAEVKDILGAAWSEGIHTLDTAIAYGESERVLGHSGVQNWEVVTKLPPVPNGCLNVKLWIKGQIDASLERLKVRQLYAVLLHCPDQLLGADGVQIYGALEAIKASGQIKKIGLSIYNPNELSELTRLFRFDLVQAPMNILDQRLVRSSWAQKLKEKGIEIHVRSAFLQGLLLIPPKDRPLKFKQFESVWAEWARWLSVVNLSPLEACVAYVLSIQEVDKLIVGVDSLEQLGEIISASSAQLPSCPQWPQDLSTILINPSKWSEL